MFLRKAGWVLLLGVFVVLAGCSSDDEEFEAFLDDLEEDVSGEDADPDEYIKEYITHIQNGEPEQALDVLKEKEIPARRKLQQKYEDMSFDNEDLTELKRELTLVLHVDLEKQRVIKDIFEEVMKNQNADNLEEIEIENELEDLYEIHEKTILAMETSMQSMKELADEYDQVEVDEDELLLDDEADASDLNDDTDRIIAAFIEVATGLDADDLDDKRTDTAHQEENTEDENNYDDERLEELLADQGNPEVAFDAKAEIKDDHFQLKGKSNLLEGSTVLMKTYQYGSENPYLKEDLEADEDGSFEMEQEVDEDDLEGEPLMIRLAFEPDKEDEEAQAIYGEEGEKLEGKFIHKFTNIKRTRNGAFTDADIEMEEGAETEFGTEEWKEPDDYGKMDIRMEKESVETKDDYYVITMNSNLNELTRIKAEAEVPGYETAGYTSRTKVRPDGSFRMHVPRPDVNDEEVIVVFEATSDAAIETEELYGEHGEDFEGDLVEKTKRGQKIEYELNLEEDS